MQFEVVESLSVYDVYVGSNRVASCAVARGDTQTFSSFSDLPQDFKFWKQVKKYNCYEAFMMELRASALEQ